MSRLRLIDFANVSHPNLGDGPKLHEVDDEDVDSNKNTRLQKKYDLCKTIFGRGRIVLLAQLPDPTFLQL